MKDVFSMLGGQIPRPLVSILLPGAFALSCPFYLLYTASPSVRMFIANHELYSWILMALAALACGEILEDLGSHLECYFDGRLAKQLKKSPRADMPPALEYPEFEKQWYEYLSLAPQIEPIGLRYIRTLVVRLKFQLGMAGAAGFTAFLSFLLPSQWITQVVIASVVAASYFFWESSDTHELLATVRRELLPRIRPAAPQSLTAAR